MDRKRRTRSWQTARKSSSSFRRVSRSACSSRYASLDWNSDIGRTHSRAPAGSSSFTVVVILARTPRMF